jgi:hypothetical protein
VIAKRASNIAEMLVKSHPQVRSSLGSSVTRRNASSNPSRAASSSSSAPETSTSLRPLVIANSRTSAGLGRLHAHYCDALRLLGFAEIELEKRSRVAGGNRRAGDRLRPVNMAERDILDIGQSLWSDRENLPQRQRALAAPDADVVIKRARARHRERMAGSSAHILPASRPGCFRSGSRRMLAFIAPQIPTASAEPPNGAEWIHEFKHAGFRTLLGGAQERAGIHPNGHDWTGRYAPVVKACAGLQCRSALIDGEVLVEDEYGVSDLDALPAARGSLRAYTTAGRRNFWKRASGGLPGTLPGRQQR